MFYHEMPRVSEANKLLVNGHIPCDPEIASSANKLITRVIKTLENHTRSQIKAEI